MSHESSYTHPVICRWQHRKRKNISFTWQTFWVALELLDLASWSMKGSVQGSQHHDSFRGFSNFLAEAWMTIHPLQPWLPLSDCLSCSFHYYLCWYCHFSYWIVLLFSIFLRRSLTWAWKATKHWCLRGGLPQSTTSHYTTLTDQLYQAEFTTRKESRGPRVQKWLLNIWKQLWGKKGQKYLALGKWLHQPSSPGMYGGTLYSGK